MIFFPWALLELRKAELELEYQRRRSEQARHTADELERAFYGRDAIDVEAREIPDTPLLEQKP